MKYKRIKSIFFLVIMLIGILVLIKNTYLKNKTELKDKAILKVAKWVFNVNSEESITNLNLVNTYNKKTLTNNCIAPGTKGEFYIVIDANGSNVGINYKVEFINEKDKPTNLQFTYEQNTKNSIKELEELLKGKIEANEEEKIRKMKIQWEWKYETGETTEEKSEFDKIDTIDGKNLEQYQFDIVISGTQEQPNELN